MWNFSQSIGLILAYRSHFDPKELGRLNKTRFSKNIFLLPDMATLNFGDILSHFSKEDMIALII